MTDYRIGQKWISSADPELGMGRVIATDERTVTLLFDMSQVELTYSSNEAPLTRVRFNVGDRILTRDQVRGTVRQLSEEDGILTYETESDGNVLQVVETDLDPNVRFSKPEERLLTRQIDDNHWFNLRYYSLCHRAGLAQSRSRGLYGPRVALIPHQLYIAAEVASRFAPRVLLADEVGLGKTIEAGLILHQQLQTGRANRVLVIVPPALTFQWFVELARRFNLRVAIMDEERCQQSGSDNPFDAQQLMMCSLDLFTDNPQRLDQALQTKWDLIIVDEAHHLQWHPDGASLEYSVVEQIAGITQGLLLLTATPEQLGKTGHFARLRLLDPDRFYDYATFVAEEETFEAVAKATLESPADAEALLDRHGTGRVLFRNVRSSIKGFPQRVTLPVSLPAPAEYAGIDGFFAETVVEGWQNIDPRVTWLIDTLIDNPGEKFLVICAHQQIAMDIERKITETTSIRCAVFHEGMDLIARDRAATYFAETERGAQVLVCSEIGSEGRNFQFASHLVMFDLPLGPDLLEQRIGRLDRIGQQQDVHIHVLLFQDRPTHDLFRWYHEGARVFDAPNPAAQALFDEVREQIGLTPIEALIEKTKIENALRRSALENGRDRLLEMNSHRPHISAEIVADIAGNAGGEPLMSYMERSFEAFGLESDLVGDEVSHVKPTEAMTRNAATSLETLDHYHYPEIPEDGIRFTVDRATALAREDVNFFTWEHPLVQQALDVAITGVTGNSSLIVVRHPDLAAGTLLLETLYVIDCVAPAALKVDRFLPPAVVRVVTTPLLADVSGDLAFDDFTEYLVAANVEVLHRLLDARAAGIRKMISASRDTALKQLHIQRQVALSHAESQFTAEIDRMKSLLTVNKLIRPEEIAWLEQTAAASKDAITSADIRLDAIRVVLAA